MKGSAVGKNLEGGECEKNGEEAIGGKEVEGAMEAVSGDGEAETRVAVKMEADWRGPSILELRRMAALTNMCADEAAVKLVGWKIERKTAVGMVGTEIEAAVKMAVTEMQEGITVKLVVKQAQDKAAVEFDKEREQDRVAAK